MDSTFANVTLTILGIAFILLVLFGIPIAMFFAGRFGFRWFARHGNPGFDTVLGVFFGVVLAGGTGLVLAVVALFTLLWLTGPS